MYVRVLSAFIKALFISSGCWYLGHFKLSLEILKIITRAKMVKVLNNDWPSKIFLAEQKHFNGRFRKMLVSSHVSQ